MSPCVEWTGAINRDGYGIRHKGDTTTTAHRMAWEHVHGPADPDKQIDHLCHTQDLACAGGMTCRHRRCVNPDHLEAVTAKENVRRARWSQVTECPYGHPLSGDNLYVQQIGKYLSRSCRTCRKERSRARAA